MEIRAETKLWVVVLAVGSEPAHGGLDGVRVPRQFWPCDQHRTRLAAALERAARLVSTTRQLVCVSEVHRTLWSKDVSLARVQPVVDEAQRGTGTALLQALARIAAVDPEAVVILMPAHALVTEPERSAEDVLRALSLVGRDPSTLAVTPSASTPGDLLASAAIVATLATWQQRFLVHAPELAGLLRAGWDGADMQRFFREQGATLPWTDLRRDLVTRPTPRPTPAGSVPESRHEAAV